MQPTVFCRWQQGLFEHGAAVFQRDNSVARLEVTGKAAGLDIAAAWTEDRRILTVAIVNTQSGPVTVPLEISGASLPEKAQGWMLQHDDPDGYNDEQHPENIAIRELELTLMNGMLAVAPYSITVLHFSSEGTVHAGVSSGIQRISQNGRR